MAIADARLPCFNSYRAIQSVKSCREALTQILDANRGSWGQGAFYTGGYEIVFNPVKQGGKNFLQVATVTFEVDMSA